MTRKTFVLDTNVILFDPDAITNFSGHNVVIPVPVLEELDRMKRFRDELGRAARQAFRILDSIKVSGDENLHTGVRLTNDSIVRVQLEVKPSVAGLPWTSEDNKIILTACYLRDQGEEIVFISKKFASRVKAATLGLNAQDYRNLKISFDQMARGVPQVQVEKQQIDLLFKDGVIPVSESLRADLPPGGCVTLVSGEKDSITARYNTEEKQLERLAELPVDIWGVKPLNVEQRCALDLLLRDDVPLVALLGPAGTGKTLLALAAALKKVFDDGLYSRLLVSRPIMPLGKDIGYLPGTKEEKLSHWMQPIHDNLEYLCESGGSDPTDTLRWIVDSPKFEMEAVTYIRGRSLPKTFMIIDEAQNLSPHEAKTIISRAGHGSKVVLTGDPFQIDHPYLDKESNGLSYTWSRMTEHKLFGYMYLEKTERSELAALAADVM